MGDPLNQITDKRCGICGDIGYEAAILICSKCEVTREHMYCMRIMHEGDREKWVCKECDTNQIPSVKKAPSEQVSATKMKFMMKKPIRPPSNSKVQYLAPEEVIGLASGATKNHSSSPSKSYAAHSLLVKKPFVSKMETFSSSSVRSIARIKPNPPVSPSGCKLPLNNCSLPSASKDKKQSASTDIKSCVAHCQGSPEAKQSSRIITQAANPMKQKETRINVCVEAQPKISDSRGRDSARVTMIFDSHLPNHPAASPTWKGTLKITSDILPCRLIDEIQAHPPCKVHSKAYNLSKQLPKLLHFEMLCRQTSWVDLFEDDVPCEFDIGLYFLHPSNGDTEYQSLLDYIDNGDFILRALINEVELFVLSSKHLSENLRYINQKHYLWGVFRPIKMESKDSVQQQTDEAEDMDVDMLGGHEVGRVDVVVPKESASGDQKEVEKVPSDEIKASPLSTAGSAVDVSSVKIEREEVEKGPSDEIKASPLSTAGSVDLSSVKIERDCIDDIATLSYTAPSEELEKEFLEDLQKSFDNFAALMQAQGV